MPDDDRDRSLESLLAENTALRQEIKSLREDNGALAGQVGRLTRKVVELETRLGKSSHNSSLPPSSTRQENGPKRPRPVPSGTPKKNERAGKKAAGAESKLVLPVGTCR